MGISAGGNEGQAQRRRAFPRIPCRVLVDYVVDGRAYRDCIANLSEGGAFIEGSRMIETGKEIILSFSLLEDKQPIKIAGEVAWSSDIGVGVRFKHHPVIAQFCKQDGSPRDTPAEDLPAVHPQTSHPGPGEEQVRRADRQQAGVGTVASDRGMTPEAGAIDRGLPAETAVSEPGVSSETAVSDRRVPSGMKAPAGYQGDSGMNPRARRGSLAFWSAFILLAALMLLDRFQTNERILILSDKVDRTTRDWVRVESRLTGLLARAGALGLEDPRGGLPGVEAEKAKVRVAQTEKGKEVRVTTGSGDHRGNAVAEALEPKAEKVKVRVAQTEKGKEVRVTTGSGDHRGNAVAEAREPKALAAGGRIPASGPSRPATSAQEPAGLKPVSSANPAATGGPPAVRQPGRETIHVVRQGENLYRIGLKYNIPWQTLLEHNRLAGERAISVGQKIRIPRGQAM